MADQFDAYVQEPDDDNHDWCAAEIHRLEARLAAVEEECADLIAGKEYQAMQRTLGEVNKRLAEAERLLREAQRHLLPVWPDEYALNVEVADFLRPAHSAPAECQHDLCQLPNTITVAGNVATCGVCKQEWRDTFPLNPPHSAEVAPGEGQ